MTQQLRFLIHAPQDAKNMSAELGRADYSYRFVLQYFRPVLAEIGTVVELPDPHDLPDGLPGVTDVLLLFMPPHQIPLDLADRAIPVFAWEYTTIPTEPFGTTRATTGGRCCGGRPVPSHIPSSPSRRCARRWGLTTPWCLYRRRSGTPTPHWPIVARSTPWN